MVDTLPALAAVSGWLAARLLLRYARAHAWTDEQKRAVPLVAVIVGALVQGGGAVALAGGTGWDVLAGAASGALAVAAHEITRTSPPASPPPVSPE